MKLSPDTLKGTYTAIVTPFTRDASAVDFESLAKLVDFQIQSGVDGLVVCGSTGEAATLSDDEYFSVIKAVSEQARRRIACVAGVNSNNTARAVQMSRAVEEYGVDGILLVCPPYNKPSQEGLFRHFQAVRTATSLPLIAYNVPGRTAVNLLPATVERLARESVVIGIKESSGSIDQILDVIAGVKATIAVLSGDDSLAFSAVMSGAKGVVSVASNAAPAMVSKMIKAALDGRAEEGRNLQLQLLPLMRAMFAETNPIPVKCALAATGIIRHSIPRLPLLQAQPATEERIKALFREGGYI